MSLASNDLDTLKGFDMVLAISESAINNQLELLYNTPLTHLPLPQPGTTQPKTEYLISHNIAMHYPITDPENGTFMLSDDGSMMISNTGIDGWIKPPTVKISDRKGMSATVTLKFCSNPDPVPGGQNDTRYAYYFGQGQAAKLKYINLNDWSVSWDADLSSTDIQALEEHLIALPSETASTLKGYVDSKDFLVSSIFCVMNSVQLVNTITIKDGTQKVVTGGTWQTDFVLSLKAWIGFDKESQGTPTPQNPFVLGYGIRQQIPPSPGVPLFFPRRFQFTTASDAASARSTLNFCITTEDERVVDTKNDLNAGNFVPSYMNALNVNPSEADGIMGISNGILYRQFIKPNFVNTFGLDFRSNVLTALNPSDNIINDATSTTEPSKGQSPSQFSHSSTWHAEIPPHETSREGLLDQERTYFYGSESLTVNWSSDAVPQGPHQDSIQRRTYIDITTRAKITERTRTNTRGGMDATWADMAYAYFVINLHARYIIYAGDNGSWIIQRDDANSFLPKASTDKDGKTTVAYTSSAPPRDDSTGIFRWSSSHGYFGTFGGADEGGMMDQLSRWGSADIKSLNDRLEKILDSFVGKIIMPAGNVFMFKGLNTDAAGNLYGGVTYASLSGGVRI